MIVGWIGVADDQYADHRQLGRLLRARQEGQHCRCSADESDEIAPFQLIESHPLSMSRQGTQDIELE